MPSRGQGLREYLQGILNKEIREIRQLPFEEASSLTGKTSTGEGPISKYAIYFEDGGDKELIVKLKSSKVILNGIKLLNYKKTLMLYYYLVRYHKILSFDHSFIREIEFYNNISDHLRADLPFVYGSYHNEARNEYMIVMREFSSGSPFCKEMVHLVLDSILKFHIAFYGKKEVIESFQLNSYTNQDYKKSRPLLKLLFEELDEENEFYYQKDLAYLHRFIDEIDQRRRVLVQHLSLTHNDFSPRNMAFDSGNILIYDWELACYQNPEHDLVEFLSFVLHDFSKAEVLELIDYYKRGLLTALNLSLGKAEYQRILEFNISEFIVNKLSVYRRAAKTYKLDFIEDLCLNSARLLSIIREGE